ncbi:MAG: preprotein translocase subunit YajC [Christensenellales bacterium]|jgi:preprotein translocase YajC subunit
MNFLLTDAGFTATQWTLLAVLLALIIIYPVFSAYKNKKESEKLKQLTDDLKVGEKVLTTSGVYGEIIAITPQEQGKLVTLKTGDEDHVGYISVDILAIYTVFRDEPEIPAETPVEEAPVQAAAEEVVVEKEETVAVEEPKTKTKTTKTTKSNKKSQK